MKNKILIIDDEEQSIYTYTYTLDSAGFGSIVSCQDSRCALETIGREKPAVVLLDLMMPHVSGYELLPQILALPIDVRVIILTAVNDVETAVTSIQHGAFDYLVKPVKKEHLVSTVQRAVNYNEILHENKRLSQSILARDLKQPELFSHIVSENPTMTAIFKYIEAIAPSSYPVLVTGETGTGKELVAQAIHAASGRTGELVTVTIAGLGDTLLEDTLFGHCKGAFTGAESARDGLVAKAEGGTLFLDEIGDLSVAMQIKLLRLLQEKKYYPLGIDQPRNANVRFVAATNKDLDKLVTQDTFRSDLYFRLKTHQIEVPPLRDRLDDIPLLMDHFLQKCAIELNRKKPAIPRELLTLLGTYSFPGNVREFESMVIDALSQYEKGILSLDVFKSKIRAQDPALSWAETDASQLAEEDRVLFPEKLPPLKEIEIMLIDEALSRTDGNQTLAAELLSVSRQTLNSRIVKMRDKPE